MRQNNPYINHVAHYLPKRTILFDTCSILEGDSFAACVKSFLAGRDEVKIVVLSSVIEELRYLLDSTASSCREKARQALSDLRLLEQAHAITVVGDQADIDQADRSILKWISDNRFNPHFHDRILLITQDKGLADDILQLNHLRTLPDLPDVSVKKIGYHGKLVSFFGDDTQHHSLHNSNVRDVLKMYGITS